MDAGFWNLDRKITHNFFQKLQCCTYLHCFWPKSDFRSTWPWRFCPEYATPIEDISTTSSVSSMDITGKQTTKTPHSNVLKFQVFASRNNPPTMYQNFETPLRSPKNKHSIFQQLGFCIYWFLLQQESQIPVIYANIYHPPGLPKKSKEQTINHIISNVSKLLQKYPSSKLFLTGDFNDLDTTNITNVLPLDQIVDFPTRGENCLLDKIFTDIPEYIKSGCRSLPPILTNDHLAIDVPSVNRIPSPKYTTVKKRNITPAT